MNHFAKKHFVKKLFGPVRFYESDSGPGNLTSQCVAALVIASGECSPVIGQGCNASATGPSGVFQLDFLRTGNTSTVILPQIEADGNIMNLCISGYGAGFLTAPPWYDESQGQVATLEGDSFITCMEAPAYVNNYSCPDPSAVAGVDYTNYIGPFCHKGYDSRPGDPFSVSPSESLDLPFWTVSSCGK